MTDNDQASFEYCPSCAGELDTGFECKQCGRDWRPWATMQLADEVQRRMDQVVEAAVEWHQAGREGGEWFDAAEKLSATIDSLLALRNVPAAATGLRKCRKCGHSKASPDDGLCDELLPYVKKEPFGMEMCGCKCEFAAPVAATADNEGESRTRAAWIIGGDLELTRAEFAKDCKIESSLRFVLKRERESDRKRNSRSTEPKNPNESTNR